MALTDYKETFSDYQKYYNNIYCFGPNGDIYNTINEYMYCNKVYNSSNLSNNCVIDSVGAIIYRKDKYGDYKLLLNDSGKEIIRFVTPSELKLKNVIGGVYEFEGRLFVSYQTSYSSYNKAPSNDSHSISIHGDFNRSESRKDYIEEFGEKFVNSLYKPFIKCIDTIIDELNSVISLDELQAQLTKKIFIKNDFDYKYPIIYYLNNKVGYYDVDKNMWVIPPSVDKELRYIREHF